MRFIDANIFIYAFYKPKKRLTGTEKWMKEESKKIIKMINEGEEEVLTTVVHISEVVNYLKRCMEVKSLQRLLIDFYSLDSLKIVGVSAEDYLSAISLMEDVGLDANDCLAIKIMKDYEISEIYSFDKGFEKIVKRLP